MTTTTFEKFTISIDDGIDIPGLDNMSTYPYYAHHEEKIRKLKLGHSFFVINSSSARLAEFIEYAATLGVVLLARDTLADEIYGKAGARVWHLTQADKDKILAKDAAANQPVMHPDMQRIHEAQLSVNGVSTAARDADEHKWWQNNKTGVVIEVRANAGAPHGDDWFKVPQTRYTAYLKAKAEEDDEL